MGSQIERLDVRHEISNSSCGNLKKLETHAEQRQNSQLVLPKYSPNNFTRYLIVSFKINLNEFYFHFKNIYHCSILDDINSDDRVLFSVCAC